jgi:hypothetical protein
MARPKRDVNASMQRLGEVTRAEGNLPSGEVDAEIIVSRPARPPVFAKRNKLTVPGLDQENYHYHWFADREGNIEARLEEGYDFIRKDGQTQAGDRDASYSQSKSSLVTRPGGFGLTMYLMRIPQDEWIARQAAASQKDAKDREDYIKEKVKTVKGLTGNIKVNFR